MEVGRLPEFTEDERKMLYQHDADINQLYKAGDELDRRITETEKLRIELVSKVGEELNKALVKIDNHLPEWANRLIYVLVALLGIVIGHNLHITL